MSESVKITLLREKLAARLAAVEDTRAELTAALTIEQVRVGDRIVFKYGRPAVDTTGQVIAISEDKVAVRVGSGFDEKVVQVFKVSIVSVTKPEPVVAEAAAADQTEVAQ